MSPQSHDQHLADALNAALMDEYKARDTYRKIIERFGEVRPFSNIVEAEQTHIDLLLPLYAAHHIPVPPAPDPARIEAPASLLEACQTGVAAEIENVALYDRLLAMVSEPDVIEVFQRLQAASRDHHLPAFQRCVQRGGQPGRGQSRR